MSEQMMLSRLIASIYEATLEPRQWSEVLARIVAFVGGRAGCLLAKHATSRDIDVHWHTGVEPHYMQLYTETYAKIGPAATLTLGDVGQIVSVPDIAPDDEFRRSRFYLEWAAPQGWVEPVFDDPEVTRGPDPSRHHAGCEVSPSFECPRADVIAGRVQTVCPALERGTLERVIPNMGGAASPGGRVAGR